MAEEKSQKKLENISLYLGVASLVVMGFLFIIVFSRNDALTIPFAVGSSILGIAAIIVMIEARKLFPTSMVLGLLGISGSFFLWLLSEFMKMGAPGRPLRRRSKFLKAKRFPGNDWLDSKINDFSNRDEVIPDGLAEQWLRDGFLEHSSIANFSWLSLQLLALGAPPNLVSRSLEAARDEVRHAQYCFSLNKKYGGDTLQPGNFSEALKNPKGFSWARNGKLADLARNSFLEGCLNEGVAASVLNTGAGKISDQSVKKILFEMADDEFRHQELAWDIVKWCLNTGGSVVREVMLKLYRRLSSKDYSLESREGSIPDFSAFGRLPGKVVNKIYVEHILPENLDRLKVILNESE